MARYTVLDPTAAPAIAQAPEVTTPQASGGRYTVVDPNAPSSVDAFVRGALQGVTLEWADELAGLTGLADKNEMRDRTRAMKDADPSAYNVGKFAGSMLVPGGWAMRAAKGGMSLMNAARVGALAGGVTGAVEAAGESESPSLADNLLKAGLGGAAGAVTGGLVSPAVYSLASGVRAGGRALADFGDDGLNSALRKTEQALRRQDVSPDQLIRRLTADANSTVQKAPNEVLTEVLRLNSTGASATDIANEVNKKLGSYLTPQQVGALVKGFDRGNPVPRDMIKLSEEVGGVPGRSGLTSMMQGVTSIPGQGREIALRNMGATMESSPDRLVQRLASQMGDLNFRANMQLREAQRKAAANTAYAPAYRDANGAPREINIRPVLDRWMFQAPLMGGETGARIANGVGIASGRIPGSTPLAIDTVERFHQARRSLDEYIGGLRRGADPDQAAIRLLTKFRRDLNAAAYRQNRDLYKADRQFASDLARTEAMGLGRAMDLRSGTRQDDIMDALARLEGKNKAQAQEIRDMFSEGMLRRMADEVETAGGVPAKWMQPLTGGIRPAQQRALTETLGMPMPNAPMATRSNAARGRVAGQPMPYDEGRDTAKGVIAAVDDEARLKKIFTDVFGNSNTAGKLQAVEDLRELPRLASELATGGFGGLRNAVATRLMNAITEKNAAQIARIVTETDPRLLYVALSDIRRMQPGIMRGERLMGAPSIALGSATGQALTGQ